MFSLYSSWENCNTDNYMAEEDRNVSLSSFRRLVSRTSDYLPNNLGQDSATGFSQFIKEPMTEDADPAVEVRRVAYSHNKSAKTLRGIDLTVPSGKIYGLLGPSGCGKTTLLRCIVGRYKPSAGYVKVFAREPSSKKSLIPGPAVGYMPQEVALFPEFSIKETLTYFGHLTMMKESAILHQIEFLTAFLELPGPNRLIKNLSGGQRRRVSLAVALVHSPPLLILDEPTVGVDPLLREVIWNHLVSLARNDKITVIITTHYIEEARSADVVGLMRMGRLLTEATPRYLLHFFGLTTLEDVFLRLCQIDFSKGNYSPMSKSKKKEEKENGMDESLNIKQLDLDNNPIQKNMLCLPPLPPPEPLPDYDEGFVMKDVKAISTEGQDPQEHVNQKNKFLKMSDVRKSISRTRAMFNKNIIRLRRNLPILIYQFFLPSFEIILFALCIGRDPFDLPLAVYNGEGMNGRLQLASKFINLLDNTTFIKENYGSKNEAVEAVKRGDAWAAVIFGQNFSYALTMRTLMGSNVDNGTLFQSKIHILADMSNKIIGFKITRSLVETFHNFAKTTLLEMGENPALAEFPIHEEEPIYGSKAPEFTEFMAPGMLLSTAFLAAVALTALAFVMERKEGLLERSLVAGVNPTEFVVSHVLTEMIVLVVQILLLIIFTFGVFQIPAKGPFIWVILLTLLQGVCGMAYGLIISSICKDENSATMLALGSMYPNLLLNGTIWPTQAMPKWIQLISYCLPQTIPIESMRYIVSRGWDPSYPEVAIGFYISIGWILALLLAAGFVFKHNN